MKSRVHSHRLLTVVGSNWLNDETDISRDPERRNKIDVWRAAMIQQWRNILHEDWGDGLYVQDVCVGK